MWRRGISPAAVAAVALLSGCPRPAPVGTGGGTGGSSVPTPDPAVEMACTDACLVHTMGACGVACAWECGDAMCTATRSVADYGAVTSIVCSGDAINWIADHVTHACQYSGADPPVIAACDETCATLAPSDCTADCMSTCLACAAGRTVAEFQSATAVDCFPTNIDFTIPTTTIGCPR